MVPVLTPGFSWIEISYARPYSLECLQKEGKISSSHATTDNFGPSPCGGTFVYVGDLSLAARSVKLSPYRPRWALFLFIADVPYILENCLSCLLHVSAALAAVNCLPVSPSFTELLFDIGITIDISFLCVRKKLVFGHYSSRILPLFLYLSPELHMHTH